MPSLLRRVSTRLRSHAPGTVTNKLTKTPPPTTTTTAAATPGAEMVISAPIHARWTYDYTLERYVALTPFTPLVRRPEDVLEDKEEQEEERFHHQSEQRQQQQHQQQQLLLQQDFDFGFGDREEEKTAERQLMDAATGMTIGDRLLQRRRQRQQQQQQQRDEQQRQQQQQQQQQWWGQDDPPTQSQYQPVQMAQVVRMARVEGPNKVVVVGRHSRGSSRGSSEEGEDDLGWRWGDDGRERRWYPAWI